MFDFAANKTVEDIGVVPDNIKPFYQEQIEGEGNDRKVVGYALKQNDPVVAAAVAIVTGQEAALRKERAHKPKAVDLSALGEFGQDPESIARGFQTKIKELEGQIKNGASVKEQIEVMKREMTAAHGQTLQEKDKMIRGLTHQLDEFMLQTEIDAAASHFPGLNPKLIAPFAKQYMKVVADEESGMRQVVVLNQDGTEKYSMERPGERANGLELLTDMRKDAQYLQLFPANDRSGGGANPNNSRRAPASAAKKNLSPQGKISAGLDKLQ